MKEGKRNLIHQLLGEYEIQSTKYIQEALKDQFKGIIKEMMESEINGYLGYAKSQHPESDDYRNGYKNKRINSRSGSMAIDVPQDRKSTFEPQMVQKRQKNISFMDQKIISIYVKEITT